MKSSPLIKKGNSVQTPKICRWCLSPTDALDALTRDESGQYKVQKIFDFTGLQIDLLPGVPSYLCTMCVSSLKTLDRFRWRCNEKNDMVDRFIKQQNTVKNESQIAQDHLDHSAEQTLGTESSIKTEVSSPDATKDVHLNQKCCTVHQANSTYECYGNIPDDLFEAEKNPIAIKSEYEEVDEQHQLQTTNGILEQDNHKKRKYHCSHCQSSFAHLRNLKIHIRTHTGEKPYLCKVCDKAFYSSGKLAVHSKIHNKDQYHQCPRCSSRFAQLYNLKIHIRTHTGEKPYLCKVCDKGFYSSGRLVVHSKIHNKDQYHQCPRCSSRFAQLYNLKIHIRTHTGEKPHQCKICEKAFRSPSSLRYHSKMHHKDQQHQCPHCSSKFVFSSGLKMHIRTHTGERAYKCKFCNKAFRQSGSLVRHSKQHKKGETC